MENPIEMDDLGYHYFWKHPNRKLHHLGKNSVSYWRLSAPQKRKVNTSYVVSTSKSEPAYHDFTHARDLQKKVAVKKMATKSLTQNHLKSKQHVSAKNVRLDTKQSRKPAGQVSINYQKKSLNVFFCQGS